MSGFARIITDDFSDELPPEAHHYLNRIQANAAHMAELIDGLLEFSKIDRIAASRHDLNLTTLIEEEIDLIRQAIDGRAVDFRLGEMPSCSGDPVLMRRVIANLLSNAVKFTEDCNPAVIEAGFDEDLAAYFISDNGVGFDDARAGKLFEVFQRLHSRDKFPGAGIGLALTRRIVEKHGGSIWAKSKPHRGATFYFSIGEGTRLIQSEATPAGVSASCLFYAIEDNPDDLVFLERAFESSRCEVQVFHDAPDAVRALNDPDLAYPDVLLVDIKLPGVTGIDLISAVRGHERTKTIPVIVLSSSSFDQDIADAYAAGASSYIVKPVDYADLESAIKTITEYWGIINARVNRTNKGAH